MTGAADWEATGGRPLRAGQVLARITMPLCLSERGVPTCLFEASERALRHAMGDYEQVLVGTALDTLEAMRAQHHGTAAQLPSLDPAAWRLVPTEVDRSVPATTVYRYDMVPL